MSKNIKKKKLAASALFIVAVLSYFLLNNISIGGSVLSVNSERKIPLAQELNTLWDLIFLTLMACAAVEKLIERNKSPDIVKTIYEKKIFKGLYPEERELVMFISFFLIMIGIGVYKFFYLVIVQKIEFKAYELYISLYISLFFCVGTIGTFFFIWQKRHGERLKSNRIHVILAALWESLAKPAEQRSAVWLKKRRVYIAIFLLMVVGAFFTTTQLPRGNVAGPVSLFLVLVGSYAFFLTYITDWREREKIEQELRTAHNVQMGLMPKNDPVVQGFDISGICKPAEEVGGDYFDYIWLDEEKTKLGIAVVDVSGKAMKGAMTAVMTSGMIYSEVGNSHSPRAILQKINRPMYLKTDRHIFTTMSFAVIDTLSRTLIFSNAGQALPLLKRDGEIQFLKVEGACFPLGIQEKAQYGEATVQLQPGDVVMFYTDGIPEAMNEKNDMFDFERLETTIRNLATSIRSAEAIETLVNEISRFSGAAKQHDDMTVVVTRVLY